MCSLGRWPRSFGRWVPSAELLSRGTHLEAESGWQGWGRHPIWEEAGVWGVLGFERPQGLELRHSFLLSFLRAHPAASFVCGSAGLRMLCQTRVSSGPCSRQLPVVGRGGELQLCLIQPSDRCRHSADRMFWAQGGQAGPKEQDQVRGGRGRRHSGQPRGVGTGPAR